MAVKLQELGFNEPCICGYDSQKHLRSKLSHSQDEGVRIDWDKHDNHIPAPLWQQVTNWLRNVHKVNVFIGFRPNVKKWDVHAYDMKLNGKEYVKERTMEKYINAKIYDDYRDALADGVEEALTLIEKI